MIATYEDMKDKHYWFCMEPANAERYVYKRTRKFFGLFEKTVIESLNGTKIPEWIREYLKDKPVGEFQFYVDEGDIYLDCIPLFIENDCKPMKRSQYEGIAKAFGAKLPKYVSAEKCPWVLKSFGENFPDFGTYTQYCRIVNGTTGQFVILMEAE